ncbi:LAME_0G08152g1_1 [Lachancea meyersii CBS 8951]|uniref:LAME_0G08152g1_1 n=1 Tax=Lachancea meyersii CBS 8951 TaxID=1266667 RepID=A0A1G4K8C0_9SACH|nr:LAME_0G08152g1_1 [Lachancea meyersii CBS 8951]
MTSYSQGENAYNSNTFGKSLSLRVDGGFNAVSISPSGRDVVLASRQGLFIVDLDDPFSAPRWLHHLTSWEVADVQWSPHPSKSSWVVSTSNQKALVWNLSKSSSNAVEHVLHGHFRAITDINFHPQHPEILATCSIDAYVHSWDMRSPKRAYYSASVWSAGASQVKWNYQNPNVMASAHANDIYIWDLRKGCTPLHVLKGHANNVNSIDFSRTSETEIMTSANDGTVKFWDYSKSFQEPQRTVVTDFPVAKGRYLPFGKGFCVMPLVGGNNSVYLSSSVTEGEPGAMSKFQPIYVFKGHNDRVSDFLWRVRHSTDTNVDDREFQLVTWSKDNDLRLWPVNETTYDKVDFQRFQPVDHPPVNHEYRTFRQEPLESQSLPSFAHYPREHFVTNSGFEDSHDKNKINHLAWVSGVRMHHADSPRSLFDLDKLQNLGEEVSMIGHKFPKVIFEKISVSTGTLTLTLCGPWSEQNPEDFVFLRIETVFPPNYPRKSAPRFKIEENRELDSSRIKEITEQLQEIARGYTNLGKYCLEPCLRFLLGEKINLDTLQEEEQLLNLDVVDYLGLNDLSSLESSDMRSGAISEESRTSDENEEDLDNKSSNDGFVSHSAQTLEIDSTPIPKGCGATWAPSGKLVCFFTLEGKSDKKQQSMLRLGQRGPTSLKVKNTPEQLYDEKTEVASRRPKRYVETLSASSAHNSETGVSGSDTDSDTSSDSFGDDWDDIMRTDITLRTKMPMLSNFGRSLASAPSDDGKSNVSPPKAKNVVYVHDYSHLIADRRQLAVDYKFTGESLEAVCKHNAQVADSNGLEDIAHCWRMVGNLLIDREERYNANFGWHHTARGDKWFVKEAMNYFERSKNVQMLAMFSCILMNPSLEKLTRGTGRSSLGEKNVITFECDDQSNFSRSRHQSVTSSLRSEDYFSPHHSSVRPLRSRLSNSHTPSEIVGQHSFLPDIKIEILNNDGLDYMDGKALALLDPADEPKYRSYRYQYAELLFYWGLLINRAELLQFNNTNEHFPPELWHHSSSCELDTCGETNYTGVSYKTLENDSDFLTTRICNFCELQVSGRGFVCGNCQHIMHAHCAKLWWEQSDECSSGCGCRCIEMFDVV